MSCYQNPDYKAIYYFLYLDFLFKLTIKQIFSFCFSTLSLSHTHMYYYCESYNTKIIRYSLPRESYNTHCHVNHTIQKSLNYYYCDSFLKCEECLIGFLNGKNAFSIWVVCFFIILDRKRKDIIFCPFSVSRLIGLSCLQSSSAETPTTHIGTSYQKQNNKNINLHKTAAVNFI